LFAWFTCIKLKTVEDAYPSTAFDQTGIAPIHLIEVASDGAASRRVEVTEELISTYIEKEYTVGMSRPSPHERVAKSRL
jgi:hypothetical protein